MTETPNVEDLLARLAAMEAENKVLKSQQNKFGLTFRRYPEQGEAQFLRNGMVPYLTRIDSHCVVKDDPQNAEHLLIEGDNISALVALQSTHKGKVDVIYIDPPYNTGNNDFVYNDRYVSNDDGFRHSKWLSFMERRLYLAKELLSETGVIFVSIDDNEQAALKILMDSVFGRENFVANLSWVTKNGARGVPPVSMVMSNHEYVLCYGANKNNVRMKGMERSSDDFSNPDNDVRGLWRSESIVATGKQNNYFTIVDPDTGNEFYRNWAFSQSSISDMMDQGLIIFPKTSTGTPRQKKFFDSYRNATKPLVSYLGWFSTENSSKDLMAVLGRGKFDFPKPMSLVKHLVNQASSQDSIVLDFFAGSGTTGHAVAALNAEDGGTRQAILVTNNFEQDGSPNGIARDVTAARMEAVLTGQWSDGKAHDALPGNLHYYKVDFKKPVANMISNAQAMQSRFAGLAALSTGAHVRVEADEVPTSTSELRDALDAEEAVLLRGKDNLVLVWQDYDLLLDEPERVQDILEEVNALNAALETPLDRIIYVPFDAEDTRDEFDFGSWTVVSFPVRYLREVANTVDMLVKSDLLPAMEEVDDTVGDEGTVAEPTAADETTVVSEGVATTSGDLLPEDD